MSKKLLMFLTAMGTLSVTLIAEPIVKEVTAKLDPSITFNINGETTLKGSEALMYNDTLYLPVRTLSKELGADVNYKDKTVYITTKDVSVQSNEVTPENIPEYMLLEDVQVVEVRKTNFGHQVVVGKNDAPEELTSQTILNVNEDTFIHHEKNKMFYTVEDLEKGMKISVKHAPIMTMSLPGQTAAFEITILAAQ